MGQPDTPARPPALNAALLLLGAALFAAAYGQAPLYYSNQNQYFLHGLARASDGPLREDWLANTLDPTPVFSGLVALTARYLHPWVFHLYHGLLLAAYVAALVGVFRAVVGEPTATRRWPIFLALLVLVHAALTRWLSYRFLGLDYPWYFQAGVAGQYILGAMLQPSVFGVLLVVAVCLFVRGRPVLAAVCVALSATVHSTYLLPGALLTLGFMAVLLKEGRPRQALGVGALTLALVVPVTAYVLLTFGPTTPQTFAEAQDILANVRIPHHARPDLWLDPIAGLQIAWVLLGLVLVYGTRLFWVLAVPALGWMVLTLVQVATGSDTLALLFPWRVSSVLVPLATAIVLARLVALPRLPLGGRAAWVASAVAVVGLAVAGVWISVGGYAFRTGDEELAVMEFVRRTRRPGEVYFLPVRVLTPKPGTRGSKSSDFQPLSQRRSDPSNVPVDLQRFRLLAEAPIYVDFKAIPYKDAEVIAWLDRLRTAERVQQKIKDGRFFEALAELRRLGVTHLVVPARQEPRGAGLRQVYADNYYRVYALMPP
jgi:hypothetical protein